MSGLKELDLLAGDDDLVESAPQQRNWRGIVTALLVILTLCSMILIAMLLFTPLGQASPIPQLPIPMHELVGTAFMSPIEDMEWAGDSFISIRYNENVTLIDVTKNPPRSKILLDSESLNRYGKPAVIWVTPDRQYALTGYAPSGAKRSGRLIYRIFEAADKTFEAIGPNKSGDEAIQVINWNPTGNDFVYVLDNDIYYQSHPGTKEFRRLTSTGNETILNGVADWLYEEEILQTSRANWWSKDGIILAYATIDNSLVDKVEYTYYGKLQYPQTRRQSYPKTGTQRLPVVTIHAWNKATSETRTFVLQSRTPELIVYLFSARWITLHGKNVLATVWANRYQNHTSVLLCTYESATCVTNYEEQYNIGGIRLWAEPDDTRIRYSTPDSYFVLMPNQRSSGNIFTQIAKITVSTDLTTSKVSFLDHGEYDVTKINHYDAARDLIYYTAAAPDPGQRHLFVTHSVGGFASRCVTCNTSSNCTFHESSFSSKGEYLFLNCKGPGTPHVLLSSVASNFSKLDEYGRNPYLEHTVASGRLPTVEYDNVTLKNGYVANVKMLLPPGLDKTSYDVRYPVLVDVYGGPGSQKATQEWQANNIDIFFAANPHYIVLFIDGRGSGNRGWRQKAPIYGALGTVEVDDQIEVVRRLFARHRFLDRKRAAIWGWSYGGFVAAKVVERDNGRRIFKCAASVAPVTNFKYYDATYTERYMAAASDNAYEATNLSRNVSGFHKVQYLLAHGTGDDNVHFQNSAIFLRALEDANVHFELAVYTDDAHNLALSRWHLYDKLNRFFWRCFNSIND